MRNNGDESATVNTVNQTMSRFRRKKILNTRLALNK